MTFSYDNLDNPDITALLFHPQPDSGQPCPESATDLLIDTDDGACLHLRCHPVDNAQKAILFFHGNGEVVSDYDEIAQSFNTLNVTFLVSEYRGYGLSTGEISASTMMADAEIYFNEAKKFLDKDGFTDKFMVMGRSLGTAPAIDLAFRFPKEISGLVIDSGFAFTLPLLQKFGFDIQELTEKDGFGNLEKIQKIDCATYIIHGQKDEVISFDNCSNLISESAALQKEFQMVPGAGHNNMFDVAGPMYFEVLQRFLKDVGIMRKKKSGVR